MAVLVENSLKCYLVVLDGAFLTGLFVFQFSLKCSFIALHVICLHLLFNNVSHSRSSKEQYVTFMLM